MEDENRDVGYVPMDPCGPMLPPKPPFSASVREIATALLTLILAFCYTGILEENWAPWLGVFTAAFVLLVEFLCYGLVRPKESWVWLGTLLLIVITLIFPCISISKAAGFAVTERVWDNAQDLLFLHAFAIYWVLSRSGRLAGGESGRLLPLDALNGAVVFPFRHFFLKIRSIFYGIKTKVRKKDSARPAQIAGIVIAVLAALWLFATAARLLGEADEGFSSMIGRFTDLFRIDWDGDLIVRIILSLPVGAYLFGLMAGTLREDPDALRESGSRTLDFVAKLRVVSEKLWIVVLALFSALYLVFFFLQGSYLFGAFTRTLPEGFVVAQYARQGFFELCKVMAVNFALLWCVTRSSLPSVRESRLLRIMCAAMLAESMLFAVIALSKLALYIDCFGFTPLRLQSSWLVCVLFAGAAAALVTLLTEKKTFRCWMIFSAVTLALLHLY